MSLRRRTPLTQRAGLLRRVPVSRMSAKRRRELPLYRKTSAAFLARPENRWCAWPGCWLPAECVQHAEGRVGDRYLDESTWLPSCWEHNGYAEDHPDEARAVGFSRSRLTP